MKDGPSLKAKAPILTFLLGAILLLSALWDLHQGYLDDWYGLNWHGLQKITMESNPKYYFFDVGWRFIFGLLLVINSYYRGLSIGED